MFFFPFSLIVKNVLMWFLQELQQNMIIYFNDAININTALILYEIRDEMLYY